MAAAAAASSEQQEQPKQKEFNPLWKGYIFIILGSLVCFASVSNISQREAEWGYAVSVGVFTFGLSILILFLDRMRLCQDKFDFSTACDGKLEGFTLFFFALWWATGCAVMTRSNGIAYNATNIYLSSWVSFGSCVYTLDRWSSRKDILTFSELTGLSRTLKSWYALFFSSIVVFASAVDLFPTLDQRIQREQTAFAIAAGLISALLSFFFILVHYRFFGRVRQGGWLELGCAFLMILFWIAGVAVLTQDNGVASSIDGECVKNEIPSADEASDQLTKECVPGSNLYVFTWACLISSITIALRWKAAQALHFASSAKEKKNNREDDADDSSQDDDDSV